MTPRLSAPLITCAIGAIITVAMLARPADAPAIATPVPTAPAQPTTTLPRSPYFGTGGPAAPTEPGASVTVQPARAVSLVASQFAFPATVHVAPGAPIEFTNADPVAHNVESLGGAFASGDVAGGSSVQFVAPAEPGEYPYFCGIHPSMNGTLVVD